ncbi:HEAT repeat domain-containing protein [Cellulomonas sp. P22]|uniref:HEAT repeat domain-containing protein n=1 Tax=Cellulomonas sp. P22 TaxID=3373189 RepID=UPI0037A313C9
MSTQLIEALAAGDASARLRAALAAGTYPDAGLVGVLVERSAIEPDFSVREMLTWALTRLPAELTVPVLRAQLGSDRPQARSQSLHTLSKIGDTSAWPSVTRSLLHDPDNEVARTAWRAAVVLVPAGSEEALAADLVAQLGRGDRDVRLSLSRALVDLGDAARPVVEAALTHPDPDVRAHARATENLLDDPDASFDLAVDQARRVVALGPDRTG